VKLIKCDNCGQSINPKRAACPFCNAEVVKAVPEAPATQPVAYAVVDDRSVEDPASPPQPWWKRPNIIIPAVVGVAFLAVFVAFGASMLASQDAARKATKDAAAAATVQKAADVKAATAKAMEPFLQLKAALHVGIVFADYTKRVQDAQYALNSYAPSDANGQAIKQHLTNAAALYATALDSWNSSIQNDTSKNMWPSWTAASVEVDQASSLTKSE